MTNKEYRLGIIQSTDKQTSIRPMYIYSLEVYSPLRDKWYCIADSNVLLWIVQELVKRNLDYMTIPLSIRRYYFN